MNGIELRRYERNTDRLLIAILSSAVTGAFALLIAAMEIYK
jgi:hypothetical protein